MRFRKTLLLLITTLWLIVGCQSNRTITSPEPTVEQAAAALADTRAASATARPASPTATEAPPSATATEPAATATRTRRPTRTPSRTPTVTAEPSPTATPSPIPATETPSPVPPTATETPPPPTLTAPPPTEPPAPVVQAPVTSNQPVRLEIPKVGVDAAVESVGLTSTGLMDVPQGVMNVAWYNPGVAPGQPGNAVFSGHFDDYKQDPAVFWRLDELEVGDEVVATDASGNVYRYQVTGKELYRYDQAPLNRIFGYSINANLNLITCNGTWDQANRNYDQRLVIYTTLIN